MLLAWVFLSVSSRCNIDGFFGWLEGKSLEALKKLRRLKRCCCFFTLLLRSLGSTKLYKTSLRRLGCYTICKIEHLYYNKEVFFVSQKQTRMEAFFLGFSTGIFEETKKSTKIRNYAMCTLCLCIWREKKCLEQKWKIRQFPFCKAKNFTQCIKILRKSLIWQLFVWKFKCDIF